MERVRAIAAACLARQAPGQRRILILLALLALGVAVPLAAADLHAATPLPPPAPAALEQWGPSGALALGSTLNRPSLTLRFRGGAGTSAAVPEVEVAAAGVHFTGRISTRGRPIAAGRRAVAVVVTVHGLRDGVAYHWRVRLRGQDGRASPWVAFGAPRRGSAISFRVDLSGPPAPLLSSSSDPSPAAWYDTPVVRLTWSAPHDATGIGGYAYVLDRAAGTVPLPRRMLSTPGLRLLVPGDGRWYVHVRAVDGAGNWGATASYALRIDRHPATFTGVQFALDAFDPDVENESVTVALAHPGRVRLQILSEATGQLVRTVDAGLVRAPTTLTWDGRDDAGRVAPEGLYRFLFTATDAQGQPATADYSGIGLVRRRLVVSLSAQSMTAYEGDHAVATTLVTTGNQALPTPLGTFHVMAKLHPFTFISPWPPGSPYYYAPSPVQYAFLFRWGGFYIHDAPWRSLFGPGSNAQAGTPGGNTTGTHGCINVPLTVAAWLYTWAPIGTVVQVIP